MTKTIEEAAKRFAEMKTVTQAGMSDERNKKAMLMRQFFHFALEELPLSERMTAAEKERVRKMYDNAMEVFCDTRDIEAKEYAMCQLNTLEEIFGKDFFQND